MVTEAEYERRRRLKRKYNDEVRRMIMKYNALNAQAEDVIYKIIPNGLVPIDEYNQSIKNNEERK